MDMIGEKLTVESSLPSKVPVSGDDLFSISHSDLLHRLKEIAYGMPSKKSIMAYGTSLKPGSLVIPLDPIMPVIMRRSPVNFSEMQARLKKFTNAITIPSVDPNAIWALDVLIQKLYENNRISIEKKASFYCDYCKTSLSHRDVKFTDGDRRLLYCKIKINDNTYLVYDGDEEVVLNVEGVLINKYDRFIIQNQGNEIWIIQNDAFKALTEKELIFPTKIVEKTGEEIISEFKEFSPVISEKEKSRLLSGEISDNDAKILGEMAKKLNYEIIEHENIQGKIAFCKFCGKRVKRKRTKGIYLNVGELNLKFHPSKFEKSIHTKEILISKDFKNFPKIPLLECDRCGKIEYGTMEKPCSCGGTMRNNYSYDPSILPVGVYAMTQSIKNRAFINHKNIRPRFLMFMFLSALRTNYINDVFIKYVQLDKIRIDDIDPEVLRLAFIIKKNGTLHENDIKRVKKLKNYLVNIILNAQLHGVNEKEGMPDQFILSKVEKFKKNLLLNLDKADLYSIANDYYDLMETVSKKYMKMIRGGRINSELVNEIVSISYPFFPSIIMDFVNKTKYEINKIETGKFMINEMLEKVFEDLFSIKKEIIKIKMKKEIESGRPISRIIFETDMRFIPIFVNIKKELKNFFNVNEVEITDSWKGLEYKIVLKKDKLGEIYRPLANTIELILQKIDAKKLKSEIESKGYSVGVEGQLITITSSMVDFKFMLPDGFEAIQTPNVRAYVDFNSNEEIEDLFVIKKLKRRICFMKNKLNVEYDDFIKLSISDSQILREILKPHVDRLMDELKIITINYTDRINEMLVLSFEEILEGGIDIGISPMYRKFKIKALSKLPSLNEDDAERLFKSGYYSIMEIKTGDIKAISDKSGVPITKIKTIKDYLNSVTSYKIIKSDDKYYCPMCESEIQSVQPFCPKCNSPLAWD